MEVDGLVDGSTDRDWEDAVTHTVALGEAPVDRETAIKIDKGQSRNYINPSRAIGSKCTNVLITHLHTMDTTNCHSTHHLHELLQLEINLINMYPFLWSEDKGT